jgi:hypothetical protein
MVRASAATTLSAALRGHDESNTSALAAGPLCQRENSTISPLIAQRGPNDSGQSSSPATHKWSVGFHCTVAVRVNESRRAAQHGPAFVKQVLLDLYGICRKYRRQPRHDLRQHHRIVVDLECGSQPTL